MRAPPVTVCHRGASALAAENTLDAFRIAMEYRIDFSELDVYMSETGDLVVTHDDVVDPLVARSLPRLAEVFDLVRGRMGIYVELKGDGTADGLGDLIRQGAAEGVQLISGSFRLDLVTALRQAAPDVPRSILFGAGWQLPAMIDACHDLEVTYAHPCFRPIEASLIETLHAAGLVVMTPHSNDPSEVSYFAEIGVDVIASDDPRLLRSLPRG